jgi:hypothetical protein
MPVKSNPMGSFNKEQPAGLEPFQGISGRYGVAMHPVLVFYALEQVMQALT